MKKKLLSYLSYGTLIAGAIIGVYVFINIYILNSKLPPGVCPITDNRPLIYTAIALCLLSFIFSLFEGGRKK